MNFRRTLVSGLALLTVALIAPQNVVIVNMPSGTVTTQTLMNVVTAGVLPTTAVTLYSALVGNGDLSSSGTAATEANYGSLLPSGTLNSLRFTMSYDTPGFDIGDAGDTLTATVMKNGVATALSCRVTGVSGANSEEEQCDTVPVVVSPPVTVSEGDRFTLRIVTTGTPAPNGGLAWAVDFRPTAANLTAMPGMHSTIPAQRWLPPGVSTDDTGLSESGASDAAARVHVPIGGSITGILCRASTPRAQSARVEVIIGGVRAANLDCVVGAANGTAPVIARATHALATGNTVSIRYVGDGAPGALFATLLFEPSQTGRWWTGASSGQAISFGSADVLMPLAAYQKIDCPRNHACSWWPPPDIRIESMRVDIGTAPTGSQALRVFVARHIEDPPSTGSTIESTLSCPFAAGGARTCTSVNAVDAGAFPGDYCQLAIRPTNAPNATTVKVSTVFSKN